MSKLIHRHCSLSDKTIFGDVMELIDHKILIFVLTKGGSSSVRNLALNKRIISATNLDKSKYTNVLILRDPYTRIIGQYFEIMNLRPDSNHEYVRTTDFFKHRGNLEKSFELFLDEIHNNHWDHHLVSLDRYLRDTEMKIENFQHIIKLENINNEFTEIAKKHNIKCTFPHSYANTNKAIVTKLKKFIQENEHIKDKIKRNYPYDCKIYKSIHL